MEDLPSGIDEALLGHLRALARRGAFLRRQGEGGEVVAPGKRGERRRPMSPAEFLAALDAGWLSRGAAGDLFLSRRGRRLLRKLLTDRATPQPGGTRPRPDAARPGRNDAESPLAWLRQRRDREGNPLISQAQFEAGERLRTDFHLAQLAPRVTAAWDGLARPGRSRRAAPGAGLEIAEAVVAARIRFERALAAVGPELAGVLIDVCCHLKGLELAERDKGWPQRAGKVVLQLALSGLARHYGLTAPEPSGPARIRHWGAEGYRPGIDGDAGEDPA